MSFLGYFTDEELKQKFSTNKVDISMAIDRLFPFLYCLRDKMLITDEKFNEILNVRKSTSEAVYLLLEWLEESDSSSIRKFWSILFQDYNLQKYPKLHPLQASFIEGSDQMEGVVFPRSVYSYVLNAPSSGPSSDLGEDRGKGGPADIPVVKTKMSAAVKRKHPDEECAHHSTSGRTPKHSKDRNPERNKDPKLECSKDRIPERSKDRNPERSKDRNPECSKDPKPERSKDRNPEHSKDPKPERSKDPKPERSKDRNPEHSKDPKPERSKDPKPERSKDRNPEHSKDPKLERSKDPNPERSKDPKLEHSKDRNPERSKDRNPERSKERNPECSKVPKPERSKDRNPERSKERNPERSKERNPERSKDRNPEHSKDPKLERSKDPNPECSKDPKLEHSKDRNPEHSKDRNPEHSKDPKLERSKDPNPERSKDPKLERSKDPKLERSKDPNPERSKDPKPERSKDPKLERSKDPNPERSKDRNPERSKDRNPERSKDRNPEHSKDPKLEHSKDPNPECRKDPKLECSKDRNPERNKDPNRKKSVKRHQMKREDGKPKVGKTRKVCSLPEQVDFASNELLVSCGDITGTLDKELLALGSRISSINSENVWYTPRQFEVKGGRGPSKNWKLSIRCKGFQLLKLIQCKYLECERPNTKRKQNAAEAELRKHKAVSQNNNETTSSQSESESGLEDHIGLMKKPTSQCEDGSSGEHRKGVKAEDTEMDDFCSNKLPVTCGSMNGILHKCRFTTGLNGKCIRTKNKWLTPSEFENMSGIKKDIRYWKRNIHCRSETLGKLIQKGYLKLHKRDCLCKTCTPPDFDAQENDDECTVCEDGGQLICCDECPKAFHYFCHVPSLNPTFSGKLACTFCKMDKLSKNKTMAGVSSSEFDVYQTAMTPEYILKCEYILLQLYCKTECVVFDKNPCDTIPKYSQKIENPMWLCRVKEKLVTEEYQFVGGFIDDVRLIFHNCARFNQDTEFENIGRKLSDVFEEVMEQVFDISNNDLYNPYLDE